MSAADLDCKLAQFGRQFCMRFLWESLPPARILADPSLDRAALRKQLSVLHVHVRHRHTEQGRYPCSVRRRDALTVRMPPPLTDTLHSILPIQHRQQPPYACFGSSCTTHQP